MTPDVDRGATSSVRVAWAASTTPSLDRGLTSHGHLPVGPPAWPGRSRQPTHGSRGLPSPDVPPHMPSRGGTGFRTDAKIRSRRCARPDCPKRDRRNRNRGTARPRALKFRKVAVAPTADPSRTLSAHGRVGEPGEQPRERGEPHAARAQAPVQDGAGARRGKVHRRGLRDRRAARARPAVGQPVGQPVRRLCRDERRALVAALTAKGVTPEQMMRVVKDQVPTPFRDISLDMLLRRTTASSSRRACGCRCTCSGSWRPRPQPGRLQHRRPRDRPGRRAASACTPAPASRSTSARCSPIPTGRTTSGCSRPSSTWPRPISDVRAPGARRRGLGDFLISLAVSASAALPMVYKPVEVKGHELVDGGIVSTTNLDIAAEPAPSSSSS